jgi:Ca-activated chloride channel family protein
MGWLRAAEQVALGQDERFINRVLLLTDGLANVGLTDPDQLDVRARELHKRGVQTTTFGVGADFDEALLERIALAGGGNFYFIEQAQQIPDFLTSELGEILQVVARDVAIMVESASGLVVRALSEAREDSRDGAWRFGLGDLLRAGDRGRPAPELPARQAGQRRARDDLAPGSGPASGG